MGWQYRNFMRRQTNEESKTNGESDRSNRLHGMKDAKSGGHSVHTLTFMHLKYWGVKFFTSTNPTLRQFLIKQKNQIRNYSFENLTINRYIPQEKLVIPSNISYFFEVLKLAYIPNRYLFYVFQIPNANFRPSLMCWILLNTVQLQLHLVQ